MRFFAIFLRVFCLVLGFVLVSSCGHMAESKTESLEKDGIQLNKALYALEEGSIEQAEQILLELITTYPEGKYFGSACFALARIYNNAEKPRRALIYAEKAAHNSHSAKTVPAHFLLAQLYEKLDEDAQALDVYLKIIEKYPQSENIALAIEKRNRLNTALLFSPQKTAFSDVYIVKPGDSLHRIAQEFGTTVSLLKRSNQIDGDLIIPGQKLKIINKRFSILVDKSQKALFLKLGDRIFKKYDIAVGREGITPTGNFKIINKLENPVWYNNGRAIPPGDIENLLGVRWMGIDSPGYGIHGSTEAIEIAEQITSGCIRMVNEDVTELYDIVAVGCTVVIVE